MRISIRFSIDSERDSDIAFYFDSLSSHARGELIKSLVRQHIAGDKVTVSGKLDKIIDMLSGIKFSKDVSESISENKSLDVFEKKQSDISEDIISNLDNLGV